MDNELFQALLELTNPFIEHVWNSIAFLRVIVLLSLLVNIALVSKRERIFTLLKVDERKNHDLLVFKGTEHILKEADVESFMDSMIGQHVSFTRYSRQFENLVTFFKRQENQFIDQGLQKVTDRLVGSIEELNHFMVQNFSIHPENQILDPKKEDFRLALAPELNFERGGEYSKEKRKQYDLLVNQMEIFSRTFQNSYKEYRKVIKKKLIT